MRYISFMKSAFQPRVQNTYILYSRLSLSRIPRDSLKYFEISVPRHIRFADLQNLGKMNQTATFNKCICNKRESTVLRYCEDHTAPDKKEGNAYIFKGGNSCQIVLPPF